MILKVSYNVFKEAAELRNVYYYNAPDGSKFLGTGFDNNIFTVSIKKESLLDDFDANLLAKSTRMSQEDDVIAKIILENSGTYLYDIGDTFIYIGHAPSGSLSSDSVWKIKRYQLNSDGNLISKKYSNNNVIWDNRSSIMYY